MIVYAAIKGATASLTIGLSKPARAEAHPGDLRHAGPGVDADPADREVVGDDGDAGAGRADRRAGQPAELAPAYVLLATDVGNYMTGALVPATGGTPML